MDRHVIAATLVAMATRRASMADTLADAGREAHRSAGRTRDPEAARALRAAGDWLLEAAVLMRLHGWIESTVARLFGQ